MIDPSRFHSPVSFRGVRLTIQWHWQPRAARALLSLALLVAMPISGLHAQSPSSAMALAPSTFVENPVGLQTREVAASGVTTTVMLGGFAIAKSRLALLKLEGTVGRWSVIGDVTRDGVIEDWQASATQVESQGRYRLWAASAAIRRYTSDGARGFFLEAGAGSASARLAVTPTGGAATTRTATIPMASWGLGGRIAPKRSPAFLELGYRTAVPLATRHLYSDAAPPAGSTRDNVTYHSWYFGRGKGSSQFYAGAGVSF